MSSPGAVHKARKRRKDTPSDCEEKSDVTPASSQIYTLTPAFPLQAFLWAARGGVSQRVVLPLVLMFAGLYRWAAGFWNYSGYKTPPMHGDFEAQRHWMEITTHLPITQWYFHDLEWWGLDYPPLTTYHSWLLGKIGSVFSTQWFALYTSRGLDDPTMKVYMRATVLISEYLVYVPAVVMFCRSVARTQRASGWEMSVALVAILMQPATILIDHAHFQYNTVMLGFVVATVTCLMSKKHAWSCIFFVAALTFKQMALYYAPAVFACLLGSCVFPRFNVSRFCTIATTTILSFATVFAPFIIASLYEFYENKHEINLPASPLMQRIPLDRNSVFYAPLSQLTQAIHRIFPLARGLFEDKVANFWCALHTIHKLNRYSAATLQLGSLALTLGSIFPPCLALFLHPSRNTLLPGLAATSLGFFLFSFQVHEKTILLPLLPTTLMLVSKGGLQPEKRAWIAWANVLGCWTMFPLLKRDELRVPYFVLTLTWAWLIGVGEMLFVEKSEDTFGALTKVLHGSFYAFMVVWHGLEAFVATPDGKPDLWVVVNACVGAVGFGICYLWCLAQLWAEIPLNATRRPKQKMR